MKPTVRASDTVDDLTFPSLFKLYGWRELVFTPKFFISLLLAACVKYFYLCPLAKETKPDNFINVAQYIGNTGAQICGTLLGIVIAGLAIITALAAGKLLNILLKDNILHQLLFPFWLCAILWGITLGSCMLLYPATTLYSVYSLTWACFGVIFFFVYSTMATIGLVGNSIQIALLAAEYDPNQSSDN
ncbi:hypothetical protein [Alicyclobacillus fastidiosus]|uniref:Uncharacterized protein n=1 Tax=Alicyclobacillus fastidiosus TaxID=392011 RepID=A0ABV5AEG6_9BACL|nr:hypothetical protein [Alicyclobacillus fastidiosus]WEH08521.1 hypothetical protein PYS47_17770 [Alicyclobacillus fastidiosus]